MAECQFLEQFVQVVQKRLQRFRPMLSDDNIVTLQTEDILCKDGWRCYAVFQSTSRSALDTDTALD